ncbi:hypothetical protein KO506_03430 [Polaribacter vadi]|uniref:hypothetical protein n=1 Tax=Polaribacter TaxID=52959 RepID=UPI001C089C05|nr:MULTISPECIES: hypothetical protein [Polaribacter]MBU3010439.1 hypothetical protein [Polaribacter vadi]MDO6740247.1 hypothetical protein [Polaribacter sp. 1_MG-2023]
MENVLKYYEFSEFFKDNSSAFSGNQIAYTELNATHFLIFEKNNTTYNLYVSKYQQRKDIGVKPPEIVELLVENYNKSIPEHRIAIKQYLN